MLMRGCCICTEMIDKQRSCGLYGCKRLAEAVWCGCCAGGREGHQRRQEGVKLSLTAKERRVLRTCAFHTTLGRSPYTGFSSALLN